MDNYNKELNGINYKEFKDYKLPFIENKIKNFEEVMKFKKILTLYQGLSDSKNVLLKLFLISRKMIRNWPGR